MGTESAFDMSAEVLQVLVRENLCTKFARDAQLPIISYKNSATAREERGVRWEEEQGLWVGG